MRHIKHSQAFNNYQKFKIMLSLIKCQTAFKLMFIILFYLSESLAIKCVSLNYEPCMDRVPLLI